MRAMEELTTTENSEDDERALEARSELDMKQARLELSEPYPGRDGQTTSLRFLRDALREPEGNRSD